MINKNIFDTADAYAEKADNAYAEVIFAIKVGNKEKALKAEKKFKAAMMQYNKFLDAQDNMVQVLHGLKKVGANG